MRHAFSSPLDLLASAGRGGVGGVVLSDGHAGPGWAEFEERVRGVATGLRARGVAPGDRVCVWLPRGLEEAVLNWAVWSVGAVWVSVPRRLSLAQVGELTADAEPRLAICGAGERGRLDGAAWIEWPALLGETERTDACGAAGDAASVDADALAVLAYTSGSTGRPKGVMIAHRHLADATERVDAYLKHTAQDRLLGLMPLNAPWGLLQWRLSLAAGARLVLPPPVAMASELVRTIRAAGVTGLAALPPTWVQLVDYLRERGETLPGLRYATTSGGVVPARILEAFPGVFPRAEVFMTYGLTEAFRTTLVPTAEFAQKKGALGRPCPGVRIEVLREDGALAADGEPGELVHVGRCVTLGYWRRPDETRRAYAVRAGHEAALGAGRVHYSGDRVRRDADGCLWFVGRADDLIKTGGYRVSPDEIESVLLAVSGVRHAVAGGAPDEELGQRIVVALEIEGDADEVLTAARQALRRGLGSHQQPHGLGVWPGSMPLTANGKLDRPAILARLREGPM